MPKDRSQFPLQGSPSAREPNTYTASNEAELCVNVANAAKLGTFWFSLETGESYYSQNYRQLLGLASDTPIPAPLEHHSQWVFPTDRERVLSAWQRFLQAPESRSFEEEYRALRSDGSVIWVLEKCYLTWSDSEGHPTPIYGTGLLISITATKNVTSRLRLKRERLEAALAASGTGTYRWNITTNKLICDESLERLMGVSTGQKLTSIADALNQVHPEDRPTVSAAVNKSANEGTSINIQFRVLHPDGQIIWLLSKGKPILNKFGRPIYMIGACMDITERKRVNELLKQEADARALEHRRLLTVLEALPVGVFITDATGKIVRANRICREIWGNPVLPQNPAEYSAAFKGWHLDTGKPVLPQDWGLAKVLFQG